MAKLLLVFATLALFGLLANASIYRTIVEFDEEDDVSNPIRPLQGKCQKEYMQQQQLSACRNWIQKRAQQGRIGYEADDFELTLDLDDDENQIPQQKPALKQCCNELRQVDKMCVCPTLRQAAQQASFQGMHGPGQVKHMFRSAKNLPKICNIREVESCQFKATPY
ncbi:hypothetical protein EUTSA_v10015934mg [Eutrema salsugineum]|uniref:Bifunctional inhibitor/plant lipid transfer protein/seed storage helical domain-containing protein n=1 Tax=Eutrema salsugineum TaxID=72664 RepID=V4LT17_EUTSA|nr:2S seed storage protein 5 [Eutrema salsugineum]ESQ42993.1 hypothetical protein EUTSA_v10015934mg [Eutrema salsugineum]